jgi:hypothetical protein
LCALPLFLAASFSIIFSLFFSAIIVDTIDRIVIAIVSVNPEILLVFVGEFNPPPLAQTTGLLLQN